MNYSGIKYPDVSNGPGCRVSLFVSGCNLHCPGCFNEKEQSFSFGKPFTDSVLEEILQKLALPFICGLSVLGGDPLEEKNQKEVSHLLEEAKKRFPEKSIWLWTGRVYPNLPKTEYLSKILEAVDILVDGPFVLEKKDLSLSWRGSANQRLLTKEDRRNYDKSYQKKP